MYAVKSVLTLVLDCVVVLPAIIILELLYNDRESDTTVTAFRWRGPPTAPTGLRLCTGDIHRLGREAFIWNTRELMHISAAGQTM
ncbi:hypothetical protein BDY19DRAFT_923954 [Irpex rosettiformis]|uniref:Uncharacterized protein n=1 Tax=Irpex rosettiformis TaxID=378272 RepID=A0ACB8UH28_9APHY|nr:hypothetical protein BDY19DRAFT_923954 [Irpex rosettiformis]